MVRTFSGLLALGILLTLASACQKQDKTHGAENKPGLQGEVKKEAPKRVNTAPVLRHEMVNTLSITRAIESVQEIEVLPRATGTIVELLVDEGDAVEEGQVLAQLDSRESQAQLDDTRLALLEARNNGPRLNLAVREAEERAKRAQLTHQQAERDFERNENAGFVSSSDLEKLQLTQDQAFRDWQASKLTHESAQQDLENQGAIINRAELAVEKAELDLSFYSIRAPFAGVIARRMVNLGASVGPGAGVFLLTDPSDLRAVLYRPQSELFFYRNAAKQRGKDLDIRVEPEAYDGLIYSGSLHRVSPTVDAESGSIRVTIALEQPGPDDERPSLLPGMMVRLHIVTERHPDALVVEKRALHREGDRRHVFVVRDGIVRRVNVVEGLLGEFEVEVTAAEGEELLEGDAVVTVGGRELEDGKPVHVANELEPTDESTDASEGSDGETSTEGVEDEGVEDTEEQIPTEGDREPASKKANEEAKQESSDTSPAEQN